MPPPELAARHGYREGTPPSDAFLEDLALHFSITARRIGSVVDPQLRVADASITRNVRGKASAEHSR